MLITSIGFVGAGVPDRPRMTDAHRYNLVPPSTNSVGEGLYALPFLRPKAASCAGLPFCPVNIWQIRQNIQKFAKKFVTNYTKTACNFQKTLLQ